MTYSSDELIEAENRIRLEKKYREALPFLRHSNHMRFILAYNDGVFKMYRYGNLFSISALRSEIFSHLRRSSHIKAFLTNARLNKFTTRLNDKITLKVRMSDISIAKFKSFKTRPKDDIDIEVHWTAKPLFNVCAQVKLIIDKDYLKANIKHVQKISEAEDSEDNTEGDKSSEDDYNNSNDDSIIDDTKSIES